ncbi:MAG: PhzF family phenazine biosynthesis protein [Clostridia bacterium]|nr:PhzF family phenazine biosynthesis protein [Clostridia bacterium]
MKIYKVDAFTDRAFWGNPAAVCILTEQKDEKWMQAIAREMNLSETAFLYKQDDGYNLRWFTPNVEVDLCGHATLASAHILWEEGYLGRSEQAKFYTRSGLLTADLKEGWIELNFPSEIGFTAQIPEVLLEALGVEAKSVSKNRFDYLVEVESEEVIRRIKPDFSNLKQVQTRGIIVTSKSSNVEYDFVSRFFAPAVGIDEDPVTGSAHCYLGPFWAEKLSKNEMIGYQVSERGGVVKVRVNSDRIFLSGQAVTILRGELLV